MRPVVCESQLGFASEGTGGKGARQVKGLLAVSRWVDAASERLGGWLSWLTLAVVLVGAFNALARFTSRWTRVDLSSNALIELQWYLFSVFFLLGGAYTLRHGGHVRVDVLYDRASPRVRRRIDLTGHLALLIPFSVFMIWACWPMVANSWGGWEWSSDPGGLPRFPIKTVLPVAFGLLVAQGLSEVVKLLAGQSAEAPDREPGEGV